ncbi:MAG: DUF2088 domain-containing protein [Candidatus Heimdallarchaeota archaeon]|nr:MAG: DUF2088 domain-containing protein [Candidatus Heimdallarchaeota archaeon]
MFSGDDVLIVNFPDNVDIIYPNPPISKLANFETSIETALNNPLGMAPLENLIDSSSRVCIGFDDISIPVPPIRSPDPRGSVIKAILTRLTNIGVSKENITLICATGLHRKCKPKELQHLLGNQIFQDFNRRIKNHDPEDVKRLQTLPSGTVVDINNAAANSDIIIYVSIPYTPLSGGYKSITVGMGSVESIMQHHIPEVLVNSPLMDPNHSEMHSIIQDMGEVIEEKIPIFQVEIPLNSAFHSSIFQWLWKPMKGSGISFLRRAVLAFSRNAPSRIKTIVRTRYRASYLPIGVFAGNVKLVHQKALELVQKQMVVNVPHQYDVFLLSIPNIGPYNVGVDPNPLLLHAMVHGYLTNSYQGKSPLKEDGVIIGFNPGRYYFNKHQHEAYKFVFKQLTSGVSPQRNINLEQTLLAHPQYQTLYQEKFAYHPLHSLCAYYWGTGGCHRSSKTILVTKKQDPRVFSKMGWYGETTLTKAMKKAKEILNKSEITVAYPLLPPFSILQLDNK